MYAIKCSYALNYLIHEYFTRLSDFQMFSDFTLTSLGVSLFALSTDSLHQNSRPSTTPYVWGFGSQMFGITLSTPYDAMLPKNTSILKNLHTFCRDRQITHHFLSILNSQHFVYCLSFKLKSVVELNAL